MTTVDAGKDRWLLVGAAGLLSFVAMFDMGSMNVALPDVATDFSVSVGVAQVVVLAYQIPLALALLPMGRVLDTRPLRATVLPALAVFTGTGVLAALTPAHTTAGLAWVSAVRVIQGVAAAVLFVAMPVLASRAVRPERRGTALSVTATLGPLGAVIGPALSGPVVDHLGWRAVLLLKIPVCIAAWVLIRRHCVIDTRSPAVRPPAVPPPAVLSPDVRAARSVLAVIVAVALLAQAASATQVSTSIALQFGGSTATTAGLVLLSLSAAMALTSLPAGRLVDRLGPAPVAITGAVVVTVGIVALLSAPWTTASMHPAEVAVRAAVVGVGMGLYGGPTQALVMSAVPPERVATYAARMQLARSLGFVGGPLVASTLATPIAALSVAAVSAAIGAALLLSHNALPSRTTTRRKVSTP